MPEQFDEFNKSIRAKYSYAIGIDDTRSNANKVSFVVTFDENGNILNKYMSTQTDSILKNHISFKSYLKMCTRLFIISREHMSNIKYRENADHLSYYNMDEVLTQKRKIKLDELKFNRYKEKIINKTENLFKNIDDNLKPYKNILDSLDITDNTNELSKLYSKFIEELNKSKNIYEELKNINGELVFRSKIQHNYTYQNDEKDLMRPDYFYTTPFNDKKNELDEQLKFLNFIYIKLLNKLQNN